MRSAKAVCGVAGDDRLEFRVPAGEAAPPAGAEPPPKPPRRRKKDEGEA